jgi:hypothetical protein
MVIAMAAPAHQRQVRWLVRAAVRDLGAGTMLPASMTALAHGQRDLVSRAPRRRGVRAAVEDRVAERDDELVVVQLMTAPPRVLHP